MSGLHLALSPLRWTAACGAGNVALVGEMGLVECSDCRLAAARAEILGV